MAPVLAARPGQLGHGHLPVLGGGQLGGQGEGQGGPALGGVEARGRRSRMASIKSKVASRNDVDQSVSTRW